MYISEKRLAGTSDDEKGVISPGTRTICHAMATLSTSELGKANDNRLQVKIKLDSCGSVAHSDHLIKLKKAKDYGLQNIRLLGIGGRTNFLSKSKCCRFRSQMETSASCFVTLSTHR
jgi:hypothetical protein